MRECMWILQSFRCAFGSYSSASRPILLRSKSRRSNRAQTLPPRCCSVQSLASPTSPSVLRPETFCMVAGTLSILESSSSVLKRNLVHARPSSDARLGNSSSESRIARCGFSWKLERRKTLTKSCASTSAMSTCRCDAMLPAVNVGQMAPCPYVQPSILPFFGSRGCHARTGDASPCAPLYAVPVCPKLLPGGRS